MGTDTVCGTTNKALSSSTALRQLTLSSTSVPYPQNSVNDNFCNHSFLIYMLHSATSCSCQNSKNDHHHKIKIFRKVSQHMQQKFLSFRERFLPKGRDPLSAEMLYKYEMACAAKVKERDHSQSINFEE